MSVISLILIGGAVLPTYAYAAPGFFTDKANLFRAFLGSFTREKAQAASLPSHPNLQTMLLPRAVMNVDPMLARGGGDVLIDAASAVVAQEGPSGAGADIVKPENDTISIYVVREGDTLSEIATMFNVSVNTIVWGNDLTRGAPLKVGQTLTILPVTGVRYTVKKGDTLASIAKALQGDAEEIAAYNGISASAVAAGDEIIVPNGVIATAAPAPARVSGGASSSVASVPSAGYYINPLPGGRRTQGIHGYNGVDLAVPAASQPPFVAAAGGEVIVARQGGWNGGYGNYIVIKHENGTQTLYAHASSIIVGIGQRVVQGQVVGYVGTTGRSTGPHLHFEIRGGPRNPF